MNYDPASSISELQVRAYTPQDAQQINAQLLKTSEAVVNRINSQAKNDILKYSLQEVKNAQAASAKAAENLANYRTDKAVFNPEGQSMIVLQEISKLQDALIQAQTQLAQAVHACHEASSSHNFPFAGAMVRTSPRRVICPLPRSRSRSDPHRRGTKGRSQLRRLPWAAREATVSHAPPS